jgi:hypothetical protein
MPVDHVLDAIGSENSPVDKEVSLQRMEKEYVYAEQCPRTDILAIKVKAEREAVEAAAEKDRLESEQKAQAEALASRLAMWNEAGMFLLSSIQEELQEACTPIVDSWASCIDGPFVIGGSFAELLLVEVISHVVSDVDEEGRDDSDVLSSFYDLILPLLKANDLDVYHGQFDDGPLDLSRSEGAIARVEVDGIDDEVNTIQCVNFSGEGFLNNNDINATAICIEISSGDSSSIVVKAYPSFWEFILSGNDDRVLKASKAEVKAKTLVHLSFKSFELGIPFDDKDPTGMTIDPHSELLFKSHIAKIEKMMRWSKSPFLRMKAEKKSGGYALKVLATKIDCSICRTGHANKQCKKILCKKCCMNDASVSTCTTHGKKPGAAAVAGSEVSTEV